MSFRLRILIGVISVVAVIGGVFLIQQTFTPRPAAATADKESTPPLNLRVSILRSEVSAHHMAALVKVYARINNDGPDPVRLGPGSVWLLDADRLSHLDRHAAAAPDAPPLVLQPGQEVAETNFLFELSSTVLTKSLVLQVGPAPALGKVLGSRPPAVTVNALVKGASIPKGPFLDGKWKTFENTTWR